jgi:hypothetical protein
MLDLPAWGVRQGHGSFLTFEFGKPKPEVAERQSSGRGLRKSAYLHGEWHLWIYCCHWRVSQDGTQLAWSEDKNELIALAVAALNGQKLIAVRLDPGKGRSTFEFGLGRSLETWPCGAHPMDEQWIILTETEGFTYRADGFYSRGPKDTPPAQEQWFPLL